MSIKNKLVEILPSLDRLSFYVLSKWIVIFISSCVALYSLATLGDVVNNMLRNKLSFMQIIEQNFLNSSTILENVLPISCLLASLFLLNNLKQHSELIALLASGYSMMRLALTCLVFSTTIALLQFTNIGFWGPYLISQKKAWVNTTKKENTAIISQNKIWIKHKNYFGNYRFFDHTKNTMIEPNLFFYNDSFKPVKFVQSKQATFKDQTNWEFNNVTTMDNLDKNQFPLISKTPMIEIPLYESPATISEFEADIRSLNIVNLYIFLRHVKDTGINLLPYYLQVYTSFTQGILCLIFTIFPFAFPMGISARHQSSGKALLYGLLVSVLFLVLNIFFIKVFTLIYFPPFLSSLLFPVASLLYLIRRLWPKVAL